MFSAQLVMESPRRASLIQHLIALAAVHGIRTMDGYQDLVSITWIASPSLVNEQK